MKFMYAGCLLFIDIVAPLVGARIEISLFNVDYSTVAVAPLVGARIEISASL